MQLGVLPLSQTPHIPRKRVLGIMEELAIPVTPKVMGQIESQVGGRLQLTRTPHEDAAHALAEDIFAARKAEAQKEEVDREPVTVPSEKDSGRRSRIARLAAKSFQQSRRRGR